MKALLNLTSTMREILSEVSDEERKELAGYIVETAESIAQQGTLSHEELASSLHREIDHHVAQDIAEQSVAQNIRCTVGCSHCCKQVVAITIDEAHLLLATADKHGIEINIERLRRQRGRDDESWKTLEGSDRDCVFLNAEGRCSVYESRPMSCRKYFSIDSPELCNIERYPGQNVRVWFSGTAEVVASGAFTARGCAFMADQLLTILDGRES